MTATLRLLRIETRRNVGLWLCLTLVPLGLWSGSRYFRGGFFLWVESGAAVRNLAHFYGPVLAGGVAWMAGRDHRRGLRDLVATTARPAASRRLVTWTGTLFWGLLAYAAVGALLLGLTGVFATWGAPPWPLVLDGALALCAYAAVGHALGVVLPSEGAAALAAVITAALNVLVAPYSSLHARFLNWRPPYTRPRPRPGTACRGTRPGPACPTCWGYPGWRSR